MRLAALIGEERRLLARLVVEARRAAKLDPSEPLLVRGAAGVVHDYYTGFERIMERVAAEFDGGTPPGPRWHRDLLASMAIELPNGRPALLSRETEGALEEFHRFRHLHRNTYGFELEWPRVESLVRRLPGLAAAVDADLDVFVAVLRGMGEAG